MQQRSGFWVLVPRASQSHSRRDAACCMCSLAAVARSHVRHVKAVHCTCECGSCFLDQSRRGAHGRAQCGAASLAWTVGFIPAVGVDGRDCSTHHPTHRTRGINISHQHVACWMSTQLDWSSIALQIQVSALVPGTHSQTTLRQAAPKLFKTGSSQTRIGTAT